MPISVFSTIRKITYLVKWPCVIDAAVASPEATVRTSRRYTLLCLATGGCVSISSQVFYSCSLATENKAAAAAVATNEDASHRHRRSGVHLRFWERRRTIMRLRRDKWCTRVSLSGVVVAWVSRSTCGPCLPFRACARCIAGTIHHQTAAAASTAAAAAAGTTTKTFTETTCSKLTCETHRFVQWGKGISGDKREGWTVFLDMASWTILSTRQGEAFSEILSWTHTPFGKKTFLWRTLQRLSMPWALDWES